MKKYIYTTFFALIITQFVSAQVNLYYPKVFVGKATIDHVSDIHILSYFREEIGFIYKAKVLDDQGKVLVELETGILTTERGEKKIEGIRILKNEINLSEYTGKLTFYSKIVHPRDTSSIISNDEKVIFLKDGFFVNKEGVLLIDTSLIYSSIKYEHESDFELEDIYKKMVFNNENTIDSTVDYQFEISQGNKIIYKSSCTNLIIPPGESSISLEQRKKFSILIDNYEKKNKKEKIIIKYGLIIRRKLHNGGARMYVSVNSHSKLTSNYVQYTNESIDLSYDFIEYANTSPIRRSNLFVFDKDGSIEELIENDYIRNELGINSPYGYNLRREGVKEDISIIIVNKNTFSKDQLKQVINKISGNDNDIEFFEINSMGLSVLASSDTSKSIPIEFSKQLNSHIICIDDGERIIIFKTNHYLSRLPNAAVTSKILNSLVLNGVKFNFVFDTKGQISDIKLTSSGKEKSISQCNEKYKKYLRYIWVMNNQSKYFSKGNAINSDTEIKYAFLDSIIKANNITKKSKVSVIQIITPEHDEVRSFKKYKSESIGVNFTHRVDENTTIQKENKIIETYYYSSVDKIERVSIKGKNFSSGSAMRHAKTNLSNVVFFSNQINVNTVRGQSISVKRIKTTINNENLMKSIAVLGNHLKETSQIKVIKTRGWKFFVPEYKFNKELRHAKHNLFYLKTNKNLYQFSITGYLISDILLFINSIEVEEKKIYFEYNKDQALKTIKVLEI